MLDSIRNKIWHRLRYTTKPLSCYNCAHSDKRAWVDSEYTGICDYLAKLPFIVFKYGICKYHSHFNNDHIKSSM
jgi:hypothetical protein